MRPIPATWLAAGLLSFAAPVLAAPPPASAFAALPEMSMVRSRRTVSASPGPATPVGHRWSSCSTWRRART
jgi:hypothetical protein